MSFRPVFRIFQGVRFLGTLPRKLTLLNFRGGQVPGYSTQEPDQGTQVPPTFLVLSKVGSMHALIGMKALMSDYCMGCLKIYPFDDNKIFLYPVQTTMDWTSSAVIVLSNLWCSWNFMIIFHFLRLPTLCLFLH